MILTVGAVDSSGGAGLDQDRRTAERLGCPVRSAVTGITVQGKKGVTAVHPVPADILRKQLETHLEEDIPAAIKIGALCEISQIDLITDIIFPRKDRNRQLIVVADPVFKPTKGMPFLEEEAIGSYSRLFSITDVITPNRSELAALSGVPVSCLDEAEFAAKTIAEQYDISVIVTGGHFKGTEVEELVITSDSIRKYTKERVILKKTHGTGCCLATALTVYMTKGLPVREAFPLATDFVTNFASRGFPEI